MSKFAILRFVGWILLLLGGISGLALFFKAAFGKSSDETGIATLWGLFIIGLGGGAIIFLVLSAYSP